MDNTRTIVVKYSCDAWSNHIVLDSNGNENTSDSFIGNINPFRYKGYYYDKESNMYYCKSRYYVPEWCRWLNGDSIGFLDVEDLDGMNLFAYCCNNPIMFGDEDGDIAISIGVAIGIAIFAMLLVILTPEISDDFVSDIESGLKSFGNFIASEVTSVIALKSVLFILTFDALGNIMMSKQKGNQRDSGLAQEFPDTPKGNADLEEARKKARKSGDTQLEKRIVREQKARNQRNKRKQRGGPNMRQILLFLLANEIIRRF